MTAVEAVADGQTAVEAVELSKAFGGVQALDRASFAAERGEVHALVGENGAGKSTLIKALGGRVLPDAGTIRLLGQEVRLAGPPAAHARGAWTVFQELTLLPGMTVAENLLLGREPRARSGLIARAAMASRAEAVLSGLGVEHIDPRALVEEIPLADRQMVEIARAVSHDPAILFLDEPTSSLVEREVAWLFGLIARLRDAGACIVFTSHRWNEVRSIADRITVFRGGRHVGTFRELSEDEAVTLMTGQPVTTLYPPKPPRPDAARPALSVARPVRSAACADRPAGGAGRDRRRRRPGRPRTPRAVLHPVRRRAGRRRRGARSTTARPGCAARATPSAGNATALVPEDRKSEGLLLPMSVRDNLSLAILPQIARFGMLRGARRTPARAGRRSRG